MLGAGGSRWTRASNAPKIGRIEVRQAMVGRPHARALPVGKGLRPQVEHFFDTNFFLLDRAALPPLRNVPGPRRWVTETVVDEVRDKPEGSQASKALHGHQILRFDDLYSDDPNVCPTFYAYVEAMFNPAIVGSEDFLEEELLSRRIKGVSTEEEKRLYEQVRRRSRCGQASMPDGTPKSQGLRRLEGYDSATRRKIAAAIRDGHPAVIRDIKNLALVLYYCLRMRRPVIFYTADVDPISLFFRWLDSMSMRAWLIHEVLTRLGEKGRARVSHGGRIMLRIPSEEFLTARTQWLKGMMHDEWKARGWRFVIKRWDQNALRFDEDVYMTFTKEIAAFLSRIHNNRWCHFTRNDDLGNWLHLVYEWPPVDPASPEFPVTVRRKPIIRESMRVSAHEHDQACKYRQVDAAGRLGETTQFV
jgi:hypothetical protein